MQRRRFRRWRRATLSSASQTRRSAGMRPCQGSPGAGRGTTRCFAPAAGGEALLRGVTAGLTGPAARQNHHHSPLRGTLLVSCLRFLCRRARAHSLAPEPARRREGAQKVSCDACALKFDCKGHSHIATQASTLASPEQFRASHQRRGPGPEAPPSSSAPGPPALRARRPGPACGLEPAGLESRRPWRDHASIRVRPAPLLRSKQTMGATTLPGRSSARAESLACLFGCRRASARQWAHSRRGRRA